VHAAVSLALALASGSSLAQKAYPSPDAASEALFQAVSKDDAGALRTRRIGRNELNAMQAALAYFDAQKEYAQKDRDNNAVLEYAQKFVSSPGKHDGLYWPDAAGQDQSPLGPLYAGHKAGEGYHGYLFKILTGQPGFGLAEGERARDLTHR
jgi:hypothetical protein